MNGTQEKKTLGHAQSADQYIGIEKRKTLTQKKMKKILHYNPDTGIFTWKKLLSTCLKIGKRAGCINKVSGYRCIRIDGYMYMASRLANLYMVGYFPENEMDHIDRIRDNDKWVNLREASRTCQMRNRTINKNNTTGVTGVSWNKNRECYDVSIHVNKKNIRLGVFNNKLDAAKARLAGEKKYNYKNCNTTSYAFKFINKAQEAELIKTGQI